MSVNISLMEEQIKFMVSTKPIVAYVGGIGAGKSFIACIKAIRNALNGRNQMMLGLTFPHARDVLFTTLKRVLDMYNLVEDTHYTLNKSQLEIRVLDNATIYIKSAELGDKLRGYTVSDIFLDEAGYLKNKDIFDIVLGRMREVEDGQIHLTTSANGFNWLYDITKHNDCEYISVSTFKNPFLPTRYIKNMLSQYSSTFIKQELYAEFVNITTGIFKSDWIKSLSSNRELYNDFHTNKKTETIRFYDFAFTTDGDYTAGVKLTKLGNNFIISDILRVRKIYPELKQLIFDTAKLDGTDIIIGLEKAGQQKSVIDDLVRSSELASYIKRDFSVSKYGHKLKRILVLSSAAEQGQLYITDDCRNKLEFYRECDELTVDDSHNNDDMVDACASAYLMLNNKTSNISGHRPQLY